MSTFICVACFQDVANQKVPATIVHDDAEIEAYLGKEALTLKEAIAVFLGRSLCGSHLTEAMIKNDLISPSPPRPPQGEKSP